MPGILELVLASASPRRTELLAAAGLPHRVDVARVTEHEDPASDPRQMVLHNARIKAEEVASRNPGAVVLGADTTVALGNRVLNKPADLAQARAMLRALSGREHTVHTGVCLIHRPSGLDESHCLTARVRFRELTDADISRYVSEVNTLDKAGAYGIQQGREIIIASHDEPVSVVMGLPVEFVAGRLEELGLARLIRG